MCITLYTSCQTLLGDFYIRSLPQGDRSMILVITGHHEPEDLQAVPDTGTDDYLTKPIGQESFYLILLYVWPIRGGL